MAEQAIPDFAAFPHRRMFLGHYHRWLVVTPEGALPWSGERPIAFERAATSSWSPRCATAAAPCTTRRLTRWSPPTSIAIHDRRRLGQRNEFLDESGKRRV
jgi:hypothetical protein